MSCAIRGPCSTFFAPALLGDALPAFLVPSMLRLVAFLMVAPATGGKLPRAGLTSVSASVFSCGRPMPSNSLAQPHQRASLRCTLVASM